MSNFTYEMLTPEDELRMVETQLTQNEREHYNLTVVLPASTEITINQRIRMLEDEIARLRVVRDELIATTEPEPATPTS